MTPQTEPPTALPCSVRAESGDSCGVPTMRTVAALDPFLYQEMRWCAKRDEPQIFVEVFECEAGRLGVCLGCGEERIEQWTRTNSEAA
jgi:hypothetical protein